jgi:1-deoxy-D-xylulose-5-phosphate synthase
MASLLSLIDSPQDLKKLDVPQLAQLSGELREFIINTCANTGGHLAPSLGVVELTLILHYIYDTPRDKVVWDVGHQSYAHKIITGRRDRFNTIRQTNGLSGFPSIFESAYDAFGVGHASTAISAALGIACARDLSQEDYHVIAVVGDGALTGGLAYEGLNNAGAIPRNFVVILNDNSMSISPNVGAMAKYLTNLITNPLYNKIKGEIWDLTGHLASTGLHIRHAARRMEEGFKSFIVPGLLFERLGFRYFGPVDGHNIAALIRVFREIRQIHGPVFVHVLTKKGKGYKPAEDNAAVFHGLGQFDPASGEIIKNHTVPTFTSVFSKTVVDMAEKESKLVAITAAMELGTGLSDFAQKYPGRFFDVGIAEGHAVTFAAGLAISGCRPLVAIYSSFLQRSFDQIIHDVALQKLPVIFTLDRAGLVGDDGPTHHGVFDLAYLRTVPNLVIMAPKDEDELRHMLWTALHHTDGPVAIRYPRGLGMGVTQKPGYEILPMGVSEVLREGSEVAILGVGQLCYAALSVADELFQRYGVSVKVVNARFIKPLDVEILTRIASRFRLAVTLEEGTLMGGFGSAVAEFFAERKKKSIELIRIGIPDRFIRHGDKNVLLKELGLDPQSILKTIVESLTFREWIGQKQMVQV